MGLDKGFATGLERMLIRRGQGRSQLHEPVIAGEIALPKLSPLHPSQAGKVINSSRVVKFVLKQATGTETVRTDSAPVATNSGTKVDRGARLNQTTFVVCVVKRAIGCLRAPTKAYL